LADLVKVSNETVSIDERTAAVLRALANEKYKWRTIEGVSKETGIPEAEVHQIIGSHPNLIIQSSIPDRQGRPLYTTREHYRQSQGRIARLRNIFRAG
jgi:hypothetical protein